jgi:hypothetical protein
MGLGEVIGVVGAVVAVGALVVAFLARLDSLASARASAVSAAAAEQSLELSRLSSQRQIERTDVEWKREKGKGQRGIVAYRNVGATTANAVTAVLTINGQRFDLHFGDVEPNGLIEHDASELYNQAAQRHVAAVRNADSAGITLLSSPHFDVTARISWESELGTPSIRTL